MPYAAMARASLGVGVGAARCGPAALGPGALAGPWANRRGPSHFARSACLPPVPAPRRLQLAAFTVGYLASRELQSHALSLPRLIPALSRKPVAFRHLGVVPSAITPYGAIILEGRLAVQASVGAAK